MLQEASAGVRNIMSCNCISREVPRIASKEIYFVFSKQNTLYFVTNILRYKTLAAATDMKKGEVPGIANKETYLAENSQRGWNDEQFIICHCDSFENGHKC